MKDQNGQGSSRRRTTLTVLFVAGLWWGMWSTFLASADARSDYLVRLLRTSDSFRVRAQAALSLGQMTNPPADGSAQEALRDALRDENPAVRAAAASSLGRIGTTASIAALRPLLRDSEAGVQSAANAAIQALEQAMRRAASAARVAEAASEPVQPTGPARYYVGIGTPGSRIQLSPQELTRARALLERALRALPGIVIAPDGERSEQTNAILRARSLQGFYLDSSIVSIAPRADGALRAEVSVVVLTYPERNMRTFLTGGGAVLGATGPVAREQAIEAAYASAFRNLETAFAASADEPATRAPTKRRRR